jgi:hypothetical protein
MGCIGIGRIVGRIVIGRILWASTVEEATNRSPREAMARAT